MLRRVTLLKQLMHGSHLGFGDAGILEKADELILGDVFHGMCFVVFASRRAAQPDL